MLADGDMRTGSWGSTAMLNEVPFSWQNQDRRFLPDDGGIESMKISMNSEKNFIILIFIIVYFENRIQNNTK